MEQVFSNPDILSQIYAFGAPPEATLTSKSTHEATEKTYQKRLGDEYEFDIPPHLLNVPNVYKRIYTFITERKGDLEKSFQDSISDAVVLDTFIYNGFEPTNEMLQMAVKSSNIDSVKALIKDGRVNTRYSDLLLAIKNCNAGMTKLLLQAFDRAKELLNWNSWGILSTAVGYCDSEEMIDIILNNSQLKDEKGEALRLTIEMGLSLAIKKGHLNAAKALVSSGRSDASYGDIFENAISRGNIELVQILLQDSKVDPNRGLLDSILLDKPDITLILLADDRANVNSDEIINLLFDYNNVYDVSPDIEKNFDLLTNDWRLDYEKLKGRRALNQDLITSAEIERRNIWNEKQWTLKDIDRLSMDDVKTYINKYQDEYYYMGDVNNKYEMVLHIAYILSTIDRLTQRSQDVVNDERFRKFYLMNNFELGEELNDRKVRYLPHMTHLYLSMLLAYIVTPKQFIYNELMSYVPIYQQSRIEKFYGGGKVFRKF